MAKRNNNFKSKSKQNTKGKSNGSCRDSRNSKAAVAESPQNDPAWYSQNEAMLRDSASYPFNEAIGTPYEIESFPGGNATVNTVKKVVPGVLTLVMNPTVGNSTVETSALNTAARKLFAILRAYNNSGNPPYDANDLMQVEIAIANAYAYVNMCARTYGVINNFVYKNRYLPKALVEAMGFDYDDIRDHVAQFRWDLDYMITSLSSLWAPGNIPYFAQCSQMYAGYYVEGDDVKDQLYVTAPVRFYKLYEPDATYPGGKLTYMNWWGQGTGDRGLVTRSDMVRMFNDLVAPLMNNSDVNIISGDVRKAFGDNIIKVGQIPLNFTILPTADLTMLEKFKNANIVTGMTGGEVIPDPTQGYLVSQPAITGTKSHPVSVQDLLDTAKSLYCGGRKVLTTIRTNPLPADVMEMTRWTPMPDMSTLTNLATEEGQYQWTAELDCGTYIPTRMYITSMFPDGSGTSSEIFFDYRVLDTTDLQSSIALFPLLSNFKFHPEVRMLLINEEQGVLTDVGSSYDLDNYTTVSTEDIHRMNDAALFSLFGA